MWTAGTDLEDAGTMGDQRYGIKIIDDLTTDYEFSPPFQLLVPGSTFVNPKGENSEDMIWSNTDQRSRPGSEEEG